MNGNKRWAKFRDVAILWAAVEREHEVTIEVMYSVRSKEGRNTLLLATYTAVPLAWSECPQGCYVLSGEVSGDARAELVDQQHLLLLSKLNRELQLARAFPEWKSEYWLPLT